jgi:hypothetical protein
VEGKVTFVHRRLWPALVRLAKRFPPERIGQVHDEHTPAGHHVNREIPFPYWVPAEVKAQAEDIGEQEALVALGTWVVAAETPTKRTRRKPQRR